MRRHIVAFLMQCPVHKTKIKQQKENTDKPDTKLFSLFRRTNACATNEKGAMSHRRLNLNPLYIKGLTFLKLVFLKDILFFNIEASRAPPTLGFKIRTLA